MLLLFVTAKLIFNLNIRSSSSKIYRLIKYLILLLNKYHDTKHVINPSFPIVKFLFGVDSSFFICRAKQIINYKLIQFEACMDAGGYDNTLREPLLGIDAYSQVSVRSCRGRLGGAAFDRLLYTVTSAAHRPATNISRQFALHFTTSRRCVECANGFSCFIGLEYIKYY